MFVNIDIWSSDSYSDISSASHERQPDDLSDVNRQIHQLVKLVERLTSEFQVFKVELEASRDTMDSVIKLLSRDQK